MNYKTTEHYTKGEEKFIAEFLHQKDATLFLTQKSALSEEERKKIIYRLYDDNELLKEINKSNTSVSYAKYAENTVGFSNQSFMFHVMLKAFNNSQKETIAQFNEKYDAILFIICKLSLDKNIHQQDLFYLYKNTVLIETLNKAILETRKKESQRSGANEQESGYHLSPLSTRPTPGGGPADYWVKRNDDKEDDN